MPSRPVNRGLRAGAFHTCGSREAGGGLSAGSWARIAVSSRRSSLPGSRPSSSARMVRSCWQAASASACRPHRYSASIRWAHSRSRSRWARHSSSSSPTSSACRAQARSASTRASTVASRASASRAASPPSRVSDDSASRSPRHSASAARRVAAAARADPAASCAVPRAASAWKRSTSTSTSSLASTYPGGRAWIAPWQPAAARLLRSREISTRSDTPADSGGSSPHSASISRSAETTRWAFRASTHQDQSFLRRPDPHRPVSALHLQRAQQANNQPQRLRLVPPAAHPASRATLPLPSRYS